MVLDVHIKTVHGVPKASNHHIKLITRTHYYRKFQLSSLIYSRPRSMKKESLKRYAQKKNKETLCGDIDNLFICFLLQGENASLVRFLKNN